MQDYDPKLFLDEAETADGLFLSDVGEDDPLARASRRELSTAFMSAIPLWLK